MLTNNSQRQPGTGRSRPTARADNRFGHIIEIIPRRGPTTPPRRFRWEILVKRWDPSHCGRRRDLQSQHLQGRLVRQLPDNCAGRCHGAGCGSPPTATIPSAPAAPDGLWAPWRTEVHRARDLEALFPLSAWRAKCAAPSCTPDATTLFLAVQQHPGETDESRS